MQQVFLDLEEDVRDRLRWGGSPDDVAAWHADRRAREIRVFAGMAGRRQLRMATPVAAVGLVVVLGGFFVSTLFGASGEIVELRQRVDEALVRQASQDGGSKPPVDLVLELNKLEQRLRTASTHGVGRGNPEVTRWLARVLDTQGWFWEAYGATDFAAEKAREAWALYEQGAAGGDIICMFTVGESLVDRGQVAEGVGYLRQVGQRFTSFRQVENTTADKAGYLLHYGLIELAKLGGAEALQHVLEASAIERRAIRVHEQGRTSRYLYLVAYNSACARVLLVRNGVLPAEELLVAADRLELALETAGAKSEFLAEGLLQDPDLAELRDAAAFQPAFTRARTIVGEADRPR